MKNQFDLTKKIMIEIFGTTRNNITMHLNNILGNELNKVCKDFLHTAYDDKNYKTKYYNLNENFTILVSIIK